MSRLKKPRFASIVLSLCLLVCSGSALAATCTFTIIPPSTWDDGTPATPADVAAYRLYEASCKTCFDTAPVAVYDTAALADPSHPVLSFPGCSNRRWWMVSAVDHTQTEGLRGPPVFLKKGWRR